MAKWKKMVLFRVVVLIFFLLIFLIIFFLLLLMRGSVGLENSCILWL